MMEVFKIYAAKELANNKVMVGKMTVALDEAEITSVKFDFCEMPAYNWASCVMNVRDGCRRIVYTDGRYLSLAPPPLDIQKYVPFLEQMLNEKVERFLNEQDIPNYVRATSKEIVEKCGETLGTYRGDCLVYAAVIKACRYFQSNPHKIYLFPLYLEMVEKHNLKRNGRPIEVEDFIIKTLKDIQ